MAEEVEEQQGIEDSNEDILPLYAISSWGADYTVEVLVSKQRKGDIFIPPFQRKFVWNQAKASRFIESLIFGLPVPGIFLSKQSDTNRLLVIDGQQRLTSLLNFYDGIFADSGREFVLKNVHSELEGKSYKTLSQDLRRRLDDSVIHATIVKQEEPNDNGSSVYQIFERLNTGGQPLKSQEIRSAVYYGDLVSELDKLNEESSWRQIFGKEAKDLKDREYILRFLALKENSENYKRPMTGFLNQFMSDNKTISKDASDRYSSEFKTAVDLIFKSVGQNAFRPKKGINVAAFDGIMVGLSRRLDKGTIKNVSDVKAVHDALLRDKNFQFTLEPNTTDENKVKERLKLATEAFSKIQ